MRRRFVPHLLLLALASPAAAAPQAAPFAGPALSTPAATAVPALEPPRPRDNAAGAQAAQAVAEAYGVRLAYKIEALSFVFDVDDGERTTRREWFWDIADNRVEYQGKGPTGLPIELVYRRDQLTTGDMSLNASVDAWFVQDQFWLLFPFHLVWEKTFQKVLEPDARPPISPVPMDQLTVRGGKGSESYRVYFGADHLIREWAYAPVADGDPTFATTWDRHAKAGPFLFSMSHRSADGRTVAWFERISVKIADQGWVDAVPLEKDVSERAVAMDGGAQRL